MRYLMKRCYSSDGAAVSASRAQCDSAARARCNVENRRELCVCPRHGKLRKRKDCRTDPYRRASSGVRCVARCAAARRKAANPSLKFGRLDDCGLATLSRGQLAIANCLKNFCPTHTRAFRCFIGIEAKPRDGAACYIRLDSVHCCTHLAFCGVPLHAIECTKGAVESFRKFLIFFGG